MSFNYDRLVEVSVWWRSLKFEVNLSLFGLHPCVYYITPHVFFFSFYYFIFICYSYVTSIMIDVQLFYVSNVKTQNKKHFLSYLTFEYTL